VKPERRVETVESRVYSANDQDFFHTHCSRGKVSEDRRSPIMNAGGVGMKTQGKEKRGEEGEVCAKLKRDLQKPYNLSGMSLGENRVSLVMKTGCADGHNKGENGRRGGRQARNF